MKRHFSIGLLATMSAVACTDGGGLTISEAPEVTSAVTIRFRAKVGTSDFACGRSYTDLGSTRDTLEPKDLRFFVQDVKLVDERGLETPVTITPRAPWQAPTVALLDFEDGSGECSGGDVERNDLVTGTVAPGRYVALVFTVGVPAPLSHADPALLPPPLRPGGMYWGWAEGHIFFKADMVAKDKRTYASIHVGATECAGDDHVCAHPNRSIVRLGPFDPATSVAVLDVQTLLAKTDLTKPAVCHFGGDSCPTLLQPLGIAHADGSPLPTAPAFRVE